MKRIVVFLATGVIAGVGAFTPAGAVSAPPITPISVCGQEIPAKGIGVLQNDLACEGVSSSAVTMNDKAVLEMNGHSIDADEFGVVALGKQTTIHGPGEITGADSVALFHPDNDQRLKVTVAAGVNLHDNEYGIVLGQHNKTALTLIEVSVVDNHRDAIADCVKKLTVTGANVTVTGNRNGICGGSIRLGNSTVSNNTGVGIFNWFGKMRLDNTTVTGNGGDDEVGIPAPADVVSYRKPILNGSTCGHSLRLQHWPVLWHLPGVFPTWGVCTTD